MSYGEIDSLAGRSWNILIHFRLPCSATINFQNSQFWLAKVEFLIHLQCLPLWSKSRQKNIIHSPAFVSKCHSIKIDLYKIKSIVIKYNFYFFMWKHYCGNETLLPYCLVSADYYIYQR